MPSSLSALVSLPAIFGLALSGAPTCAADSRVVWIAMCGGHASRPLPIGPQKPVRDRDCPAACHAACPRKHALDEDSG